MIAQRRWAGGRVVAALAIAALAAGAHAQSVLYITPDRAETAPGNPVLVTAQRIEGAALLAPAPWPTERIAWMFVRAGGGQQNFEPGAPAPDVGRGGAGPNVTVDALDAVLAGVDLEARDEELSGKALAEWAVTNIDSKLLPKGFDVVGGAGGMDKVVVRRVESAKALWRGRGPGEQMRGNRPTRSATATDKSGQAVEIRPMLDPTAAVTPTDMPLRLYAFGEGAKGAMLRVVHVPTGNEQDVIANDKGIAWVRIEETGEYRVAFHAIAPFVPAEGDNSKATWALHSATCTFTVPALPKAEQPVQPSKGEEEKSR